MKTLTWLAAALAITFAPATAAAGGYQVDVHPPHPAAAVPAAQLSRMFLKKLPKWDHGAAVVPVDQPVDAPVRAEFSKGVHGKAVAAVAAYWQQQIFAGRDVPPAEKAGDDAVLAFVRANPGAVGYVSAAATTTGVKVLEVK
jgi:ABC-type phosphate transport system substrate-binding protein